MDQNKQIGAAGLFLIVEQPIKVVLILQRDHFLKESKESELYLIAKYYPSALYFQKSFQKSQVLQSIYKLLKSIKVLSYGTISVRISLIKFSCVELKLEIAENV